MKNNNLTWKTLETKELPNSEIEISCSVEKEFITLYRREAIKNLQKGIDLAGFRKGQIPEKVIVQKIGEIGILEEVAEIIISELYPKIVDDKKFLPISRPAVTLKKIAPENDIEFSITVTILPKVELPDYKKIALEILKKPKDKIDIDEKELEETILNIRKMYSQNQVNKQTVKDPAQKEPVLPELNDEFIKKMGKFESVEDFKNHVKEGLKKEQEEKYLEKRRLEILENIDKETKIETPKMLIDGELNKMLNQFDEDVKEAGVKIEDYLKHIGKTIEDLRKEWKIPAEKRARTQLLINAISKKENLRPNDKEVHDYAHIIMNQYKDAKHDSAMIYADVVLTNKKVIEFLENLK